MNLRHPVWRTALGTALGYVLILAAMTLLLFGLAYLAFTVS